MGLNAGFEFIDGEWAVGDPGIEPEEEWMISVADLSMCFITISTDEGGREFFFGANPTIVFDVDPKLVPDYDGEVFRSFFVDRYPEAEEKIVEFAETYRIMAADTEPTYDGEVRDGGDLVAKWCAVLGIPSPLEAAE